MALTHSLPAGGGGRSSLDKQPAGKRPGKNTARKSTGGKAPRKNRMLSSFPLVLIANLSQCM